MDEIKKIQEVLKNIQIYVWIGFVTLFLMSMMSTCNSCTSKNDVKKVQKEMQVQIVEKDSTINAQSFYIIELEREKAALGAQVTVLQAENDKKTGLVTKSLEKPTNVTVKVSETDKK